MSLCILFAYCPGRRKAAFLLEHVMTTENFQACLAFTLKYEGGKSNDPRDPGGRTMKGVTQATYDAYRVKKALGRRDVFAIEAAERDEIYRTEYWEPVAGYDLRAGEDLCIFDFAVNSGVARARVVKASWHSFPITDAIEGICARRLSFLHALRTWSHFGAGWGRRVAACEALALRMAYGNSAPEVLTRRAREANRHSGKKSTQAVAGGTIMGSATIAHAVHGGMSGTTEICLLVVVVVLAGIFFFHAWRQSQRSDALTAAVAQMRAAQVSAAAALEAATAQAAVKEKAIAAEQDALIAAKAAILAASPTPVPPSQVTNKVPEEAKR
jgi:lysozyme family protein